MARIFETFGLAAAALLLAACEAKPDASAAGASAAAPAPAPASTPAPAPAPAGGVCGGSACAAGAYCKLPDGQCDAAADAGRCTPRAEMCSQQYEPVCGCDGKTYGNACAAEQAGINVASEGECGPAG